MELKINIGSKEGKSIQKTITEADAKKFFGMKVGDNFKGEMMDLVGYEFLICGGMDESGAAMRKDINLPGKKKILSTSGIGIRIKEKGIRKRKTVAGNTIFEKTAMINVSIVKSGKDALFVKAAEPAKAE